MKNEQLDALVLQIEGLQSAALSDSGGTVQAHSSGFDADVPCAVAAICGGQLEELGRQLGSATVRDWTVATSTRNVYVVQKEGKSVVALGLPDDKPTKTAEMIAEILKIRDH